MVTIFRVFALISALTGLPACSALEVFDTAVPYDSGAEQVASDIAYGNKPRQTLSIYRPDGLEGSSPVVFFIYGGSWSSGTAANYEFVGHAFAAKGYVTVIANYRLVPKIRYPVFIEDGARALAWTYRNIDRYGGNPDRIFVVGHSAGAYNAIMLAADPAFLKARGLSPKIVRAVVGLSGPYDFLPLDVKATREAFKGVSELDATQPVNLVHAGMPPVFIAWGAEDELVGRRNIRTLDRQLGRAGVAHEKHIYPGIGHAGTLLAISRPFRSKTALFSDMMDFLHTHGGT